VDWDDDGDTDIIVGDRLGYVTFFSRTGPGISDLTSEGHLTASSVTIDVGANSAPVVVDWNEDGLLDLLIGNELTSQGIRLYLNSGTPGNPPVLTTWTYIQSSGSNINRYRCCPQVYDLNQDGKKDLIMGENNAQVYYYENTGTNAAPVFSGFEALQSNGSPIDLYYGSRLWVNDWDENGLPDLLLSDYNGNVNLYLQPTGIGDLASLEIGSDIGLTVAGNPTSGPFALLLSLGGARDVTVKIFDASGRLVQETAEGWLDAGEHLLDYDLGECGSGLYLIRCETGNEVVSGRIAVIR